MSHLLTSVKEVQKRLIRTLSILRESQIQNKTLEILSKINPSHHELVICRKSEADDYYDVLNEITSSY